METIKLSKKRIVELNINDEEFIATLDNYTIEHFQTQNKKGLLKAFESVQDGDISVMIQLLGSMIRYKKNGKIVGVNFLNQFDVMQIIEYLSPVIGELFTDNLPDEKDEGEGK